MYFIVILMHASLFIFSPNDDFFSFVDAFVSFFFFFFIFARVSFTYQLEGCQLEIMSVHQCLHISHSWSTYTWAVWHLIDRVCHISGLLALFSSNEVYSSVEMMESITTHSLQLCSSIFAYAQCDIGLKFVPASILYS